MVSITIDANLARELSGADGDVEFRDDAGNLVGVFQPVQRGELPTEVLASFDVEEMRRREQEGGPTYTTAEVLQHLQSLDEGSN